MRLSEAQKRNERAMRRFNWLLSGPYLVGAPALSLAGRTESVERAIYLAVAGFCLVAWWAVHELRPRRDRNVGSQETKDPFDLLEPSADMRQAAAAMRHVHASLVKVGYSEDKAFDMIARIVAAQNRRKES
jgi:hypothetical protein